MHECFVSDFFLEKSSIMNKLPDDDGTASIHSSCFLEGHISLF